MPAGAAVGGLMTEQFKVQIDTLAQNVFRICIGEPNGFIAFNHFLIVDECPVLMHLGHRQSFDLLYRAVAEILDPAKLRYLAFSHYEADECGALNQWLETAPDAEVLVGKICASSLRDFALRPPTVLHDGQSVLLGRDKLILLETPHFPHNWDACLFYLKGQRILFGSDLGTQKGLQPVYSEPDTPVKAALALQEAIAFMPWGPHLDAGVQKLQSLQIDILATMHGSALNQQQTTQFLAGLTQANQRSVGAL